jgi:protease I
MNPQAMDFVRAFFSNRSRWRRFVTAPWSLVETGIVNG